MKIKGKERKGKERKGKEKNGEERKGEEKESYIFIVYYIIFNITGGGLLVLFDDELTTF